MAAEPPRPDTVPADATWNSGNNEWELGDKAEDGSCRGEWRYWLAPDGHLVCRSTFTDAGSLVEYERYHPNGEPSQRGRLEGSRWLEQCWMRSSAPTTEVWEAWGQPENCWMARKIIGSVPLEFEYFDRDGHQLNAAGERLDEVEQEDFSSYLVRGKNETVRQALERYEAFFDAAFGSSGDANVDWYRLEVYAPAASRDEVTELEQRLGVSMPAPWTDHVTKHGFFRLGGQELATLDGVTSLLEWLAGQMGCDLGEVGDLIELDPTVMQRAVCFCFHDSEVVCFRFDVQAQGDPPIATLWHDDPESFEDDQAAASVSFDEYVSDLVDETIRGVAEKFSLTC